MKKFHISNYKKGFVFSLVLHAALVATLFIDTTKELKQPENQKLVSLSLSSFALPQKIQETAKPIQEPAKVAKAEPVIKKEQKVCKPKAKKSTKQKKHYKKEALVKEEVVEQEIANEEVVAKQEPVQETPKVQEESKEELVKNEATPQTSQETQELAASSAAPSAQSLEKEFVQTNFEIIRNLVLENLKYPHMAKRMQQTGIVQLMLVIDAHGKLIDIVLKNSSGHKLLDKSAMSAAERLADLVLPAPNTTSRIMLPIAFALN